MAPPFSLHAGQQQSSLSLSVKRRKSYSSYIYYNNICGQLNSSTGGLAALSLLGTQKRIINCLVLVYVYGCVYSTHAAVAVAASRRNSFGKKASRLFYSYENAKMTRMNDGHQTRCSHSSLFLFLFSRFFREKIARDVNPTILGRVKVKV